MSRAAASRTEPDPSAPRRTVAWRIEQGDGATAIPPPRALAEDLTMRVEAHTLAMTFLALLSAWPLVASAQQLPNPYGAPVGVEAARRVAQAAMAEAHKNGWIVAVAVVDPSGNLVYYEKMDNTQLGSAHVSIDKARSAALFKRPTKAFEDAVNAGKPNTLGLPGAVPLEGGVPLIEAGKIVGAVGVSGGTSQQDGVCAKAGVDALGTRAASSK